MFIKLTKKDGAPIWLNANFVVTLEPVRGGTVVVPVGDGLDYEVRESVESIIPLLEEDQGQLAIVPVPTTDALTQSPQDAIPDGLDPLLRQAEPPKPAARPEPSPAPEPVPEPAPAVEPSPEAEPPQYVAASGAEVPVSDEEAAAGVAAFAAYAESVAPKEPVDPKKARRERKAKDKPAPAGTPATEGERKIPKRRRTARKMPLELTAEQIDRLRKMKPRSVNKTINTLKSAQFGVADAEATVRALVEHGVISVDSETEHITWLQQEGGDTK